MDASVLAVPAAGAIVSTVLKELSKAFMLKKWFHGNMTAYEAEQLMMQRGKNGSFLVRESRTSPGDFALSVRVRGRVSHVVIRKQDNKYDVGAGEQFDDLAELIEHYRAYPIVENSGDVLRLLQPLSSAALGHRAADTAPTGIQSNGGNSPHRDVIELNAKSSDMADDHAFTTVEAQKPENRTKNRYNDVLPYDQTRVVLCNEHGTPEAGSDYINASYIRLTEEGCANSSQSSTESLQNTSQTDKVYIATQGCLSNTEEDFWHMIWQEDIRVIVMLTKDVELNKRKCATYWPELHEEKVLQLYTIKLVSKEVYNDYTRRELIVKNRRTLIRTVYQYQFTSWCDHSAPINTESLLSFIHDVNTKMKEVRRNQTENAMLCVHCSAGVGRTGTFIVLDFLIGQIQCKGACSKVDIYRSVEAARTQRRGMVQNRAQYEFLRKATQDYASSLTNPAEKTLSC